MIRNRVYKIEYYKNMKHKIITTIVYLLLFIVILLVGYMYKIKDQQTMTQQISVPTPTQLPPAILESKKIINSTNEKNATQDQLRAKAYAYYLTEDYKNAGELYKQLIKTFPQDPTLYQLLADTFVKQKNYEEAKSMYKTSINLKPKNNPAITGLAGLFFDKLFKPEEAITVYTEALANDSNNIGYMMLIANIYKIKGNYEMALSWYGKALIQDPDNYSAKTQMEITKRLMKKTL